MYINFWYPAVWSKDLGDEPQLVRMLGLNFVLFRDADGNAQCLANTCPHRGGSLAHGVVEDGCIQCPYHGWRFDGEGDCKAIPSMGADAKIPARAKADAYPTQEKYGIVFAFLGDLPSAERPPIMEAPEWGDEAWSLNLQDFEIGCNFQRSVENALDPAHNEFVHPTHGFSGKRPDYRVPDYDLMETDWGTGFMVEYVSSGSTDSKLSRLKAKADATVAGSGNHGPTHFWTHIHVTPEFWMHQYIYELPVEENLSKMFLVNFRNALIEEEHDARFRERNAVVAQQDVVVLEVVEPVLTPETNTKEILVPADKAIARYREILKGYEAKGWRIDTDAMNAEHHRKAALVIPSPARRTHKGWTLDTVPLLPGDAEAKKVEAAE